MIDGQTKLRVVIAIGKSPTTCTGKSYDNIIEIAEALFGDKAVLHTESKFTNIYYIDDVDAKRFVSNLSDLKERYSKLHKENYICYCNVSSETGKASFNLGRPWY